MFNLSANLFPYFSATSNKMSLALFGYMVEGRKYSRHASVEITICMIRNIGRDDYKFYFKYSILEICNMNLGNEHIINRENYWKEVLLTRQFGLNKN